MIGPSQTDSQLDSDRLRRLIDAGRSLVAERDLDRVLDRLLGVARELTDARRAALGILDESHQRVVELITAGSASTGLREGVLDRLTGHPQPQRLVEVTAQSTASF